MTEIVAWWGAVLATVVFIWDIYKWSAAGLKLRISVQTGMTSVNMPDYQGKSLITIDVSNFGDRPTTITNLGYYYFSSSWKRFLNQPDKAAIVPKPSDSQRLPFELKPGGVWMGIAVQDEELTAWAKEGLLYCVLYHSHNKQPVYKRVVVK